MESRELTDWLLQIFGSEEHPRFPKFAKKLMAAERCRDGAGVVSEARTLKMKAAELQELVESVDKVRTVLGVNVPDVKDWDRKDAAQGLGQMLVGRCAEMAFPEVFQAELTKIGLRDYVLTDSREDRSTTDFRLFNGTGLPIYRFNVKYHGSLFARAQDLVGLEPEDCFALATYKIYLANQKSEKDHLPYIFAIVGVRDIAAASVGEEFADEITERMSLIKAATKRGFSKKDIEDAIIDTVVSQDLPIVKTLLDKIKSEAWYILSGFKAHALLKNLMFKRCYALVTPRFTFQFKGAEVDMHFSISQDLVPLNEFLRVMKEGGIQKVTTMLATGKF